MDEYGGSRKVKSFSCPDQYRCMAFAQLTYRRSNWERVIPFLAFSANVRKAVYTTNQIESLNSALRRAVRRMGHFPGDDSARKLLYLVLRDIKARWKGPPAYWPEARREFAIQFGDRFRLPG